MSEQHIGSTSELFCRVDVVVRGYAPHKGVEVESQTKTRQFRLHPTCARELGEFLIRAAAVAEADNEYPSQITGERP